MPNADVAWVDVLPSARQFLPKLQQATGPAARTAGQSAGREFGSSFGRSSTGAVEQASAKMSAALRKTADAAGQVRVQEQRLKELRESGKASTSQVVAAEERLASARRKETAANSELATATTRVKSAQDDHTAAVGRSGRAMDDGTRKAGLMSRTFGGMRGAVTAGFAAFYGAQTAVNFIGGAIGAARDLGETVNKSNVIFGANAKVIDTWAQGASRSIGMSRQAALETAAGFGNMYTQLGFTADAAANLSTKTVQMAADLGSFNNLPTADVAEMISGAFRGEYDSLQRLIPNISAARVEQEAMTATGKKTTDALTAQDKATAVLAIVQKDGAAAMGDFARTSDGLANSQKILSAEWDNGKARLGELLVGPATGFVHWLTDAIPKVEALGGWIAKNTDWLLPLGAAIASVIAVVKIWSVAQRILNFVLAANPVMLVVTAIISLIAILVTAYKTSDKFRAVVDAAFKFVAAGAKWLWEKAIRPYFTFVIGLWTGVGKGMKAVYDNVISPIWTMIREALKLVVSAFRGSADGVAKAWKAIQAAAAKPVNFVVRTVLRDGLFKAWNWLLDKIGIKSMHVDLGARWLQGIPGYAGGGYTGDGARMQPAGVVHAGEFVLTKKQTQRAGVSNLYGLAEALERGRGWANGGLVALGRRFQSMGARVSEHPAFGGVTPGAHVAGSQHYLGNAIDVNTRPGTSAQEQRELSPMAKIARDLGYYVLWLTKGHFNHLHVDGRKGGGGSAAGPQDSWWSNLWGTVTGAKDWLLGKASAVGRMASQFGNSPLVGWLKEMPGKIGGAMWDQVKGSISDLFESFVKVGQFDAPGDTASAKRNVQGIAYNFGWQEGAQWNALSSLIQGESGWRWNARNPTSSASGLFQQINSTWRAYRPVGENAATMADALVTNQAWAGLRYIKDVYGTPLNAYRMWSARAPHWYADGGLVGRMPVYHGGGTTAGWRREGPALLAPDERILSAPQDTYFRRFVDAAETGSVGQVPDVRVYIGERELTEIVDVRIDYRDEQEGIAARSRMATRSGR